MVEDVVVVVLLQERTELCQELSPLGKVSYHCVGKEVVAEPDAGDVQLVSGLPLLLLVSRKLVHHSRFSAAGNQRNSWCFQNQGHYWPDQCWSCSGILVGKLSRKHLQ